MIRSRKTRASFHPSTPEFVNEAVEAGFTVDQLLRAERALSSGNNSPIAKDILLSKEIVKKLVSQKRQLIPWKGPLPKPRISPPRTLGDCLATALPASSSSSPVQAGSHGSSLTFKRSLSGEYQTVEKTSSSPLGSQKETASLNSNLFEHVGSGQDPQFPPLILGGGSVGSDPIFVSNKFDRPSAYVTEDHAPSFTGGISRERHGVRRGNLVRDGSIQRVKIGPGCFYRPTKGLAAFFLRTGSVPNRLRHPRPKP